MPSFYLTMILQELLSQIQEKKISFEGKELHGNLTNIREIGKNLRTLDVPIISKRGERFSEKIISRPFYSEASLKFGDVFAKFEIIR